ncbi:antileukoproteinase-like [Dreissena polymorpha]|uniref:antileukoproteinase-like n=1 Tax=Dreissena polymorpha TaxID=45954 RepID=UPI002264AAF9|nr:antileukoproteinase-like [Dreissena polymorpha]
MASLPDIRGVPLKHKGECRPYRSYRGKRQCTADDDVTMICPVQCQGDDTCPGSQKCCQYGCMITCLDPVSYDGPTTRLPGPCIVRLAEWEAANRCLGFERPLYAANGDSMGTQYQGSQAICVTPDGTEISCFAVNRVRR